MNRRLITWGVIAVAIAIAVITAQQGDVPPDTSEGELPFDFYVLALSWSPAFCLTEQGQRSTSQCGANADFGFITHGLWPQFEDGWPSFCQSPHGAEMSNAQAERLFEIMPDRGLIAHQWDKHGTCTGLSQADYISATLAATQAIAIPAQFSGASPNRLNAAEIERAFIDANEGLESDGIAVSCPNGRFREVRVCLSTDLEPRACPQVDRQGCQQETLVIAPR